MQPQANLSSKATCLKWAYNLLPQANIVLPCYQPPSNWWSALLSFNAFICPHYTIHYIVVNDGGDSTQIEKTIADLTAKGISIELHGYQKNRGKGYALRTGVKLSKAPVTLYTDIDFPFTNESTKSVLDQLVANQADVVAGFRNQSYYAGTISPFRRLLSKTFRGFLTKVLKLPMADTQCGLKAFNEIGRQRFLSTTIDRYLFDFEFIYGACRDKQCKLLTTEVTLKPDIVFRKMKLKILLQEGFNLLRVLLKG